MRPGEMIMYPCAIFPFESAYRNLPVETGTIVRESDASKSRNGRPSNKKGRRDQLSAFDDPHRCFEPECHQGFGGDLNRLTPRQNLGGTASRGSREPTNNQAFTAARNGSDNPAGGSTSTDELARPFVLTDTLLAFFANIGCLYVILPSVNENRLHPKDKLGSAADLSCLRDRSGDKLSPGSPWNNYFAIGIPDIGCHFRGIRLS